MDGGNHSVQVDGSDDRTVTDAARGDVELFLPLRNAQAGLSVVTYAPRGEDGYFLLYVTPPDLSEAARMGRDLTMVVDVSGPMSGPKLEQAKAAMLQMLGALSDRDRLRLIAFSTGVRTFRDGYSLAGAESLERARQWTGALVAAGGTNIEGALREAMQRERDGRTVRVSMPVEFAAREDNHEYVSTLWAARRIGSLTRTMRLEGATPDRIAEIKALALRHGIVTEYTADLVQEPVVSAGGAVPDRDGWRRGGPEQAASPSAKAQTGRAAFSAAQTSADYLNAVSLNGARQGSERAQDRGGTASAAQAQRTVGSRRFEQQGAQWMDLAQRGQRVVSVEAFSPAYFVMLRALPELRDAALRGDDVLVAGQRVSIRIQRVGQATLPVTDVQQLVKDFRGA